MVRERTHEATRHAEHLRSAVDGAVQRARDSRSSEVRLHLPALPRSCQRHTHTQPDLIPPTLPPRHSDLASATCQVPRSTESRGSFKANSPVVVISRHQIKMSKKRNELDWRAGVNARKRAAKAVAAAPSPPPSTSSPRTTQSLSCMKASTLTHAYALCTCMQLTSCMPTCNIVHVHATTSIHPPTPAPPYRHPTASTHLLTPRRSQSLEQSLARWPTPKPWPYP